MFLLIWRRGESRTFETTKMEILVSTINDSQSLFIFTENFALDAIGMLDPRDRPEIRL